MNSKGKYYITTPIYYPSANLHIGHTYCTVMADAMARFKRLQGYDVMFLTGTDEHGQKIQTLADAKGVTPQEYVDEVVAGIIKLWETMEISYDDFIRTTEPRHIKSVQDMFMRMYEKGDIYKGEYEGLYCTPCESFWTKSQLVDGCCPDCGRPVKEASEEAYFFRMSKYAPKLIKYIDEHPEFIQPEARKNEMVNTFLKPGLQDLCVSRTSFKWGIPVDFDSKHVVYVWIDALSNYITGLGYDVDGNSDELYKKYWPADLHLIGKDILRFHTIYWPIMLMALGEPLPKQVFGHPWLLQSDGKMSKSRGNVLYADDMVDLFGVDAVRYFLLHEMPFENDGVVSWELLIERVNSDLANVLGNLVNRTISMSNKYFGGVVTNTGVNEEVDDDLKRVALDTRLRVNICMDKLRVADAMTEIWNLFKRCNKYIDETMPWALAKEEDKKGRLNTVLYNLIESITMGASLLEPFMPDTSASILKQLGVEKRTVTEMGQFGLYPNGNKVTSEPEILFARIDTDAMLDEIEKRFPSKPAEDEKAAEEAEKKKAEKKAKEERTEPVKVEAVQKAILTIDDFDKMQLQIGEVLSCEEVPKSKKLLCSQVQVAGKVLQIVSGIKNYYKPEDMVGKKVVVITNLAPAKLAGVLSEGMLLCAEDDEGNLALLTADKDVPAGSMIS